MDILLFGSIRIPKNFIDEISNIFPLLRSTTSKIIRNVVEWKSKKFYRTQFVAITIRRKLVIKLLIEKYFDYIQRT